ncbi:InlB B-repeat-containing protein [Rhodohalobacter mucosus]|uniref:Bacterial repeat domain-containing protein n=1 Tax=Rhodohalobacter mucosus TaxID=2079485 RepID=A0A316TY06_9BACT|nr:hypothetical protein [Rhodohalobacter mucosus]PWN07632.1 hypothetical protein DDZ15_05085 [Rhodohalobacter mucosus]
MKTSYLIAILFGTLLTFSTGCGTTDSGGGDDNPPETTTYTLSTSVSPQGGGSVTPSSGTFDEGTNVSVEATANEGWIFDSWSGDIQSTDNPLNFSITSNTTLTANFTDISSSYIVDIAATNGPDQIDLRIGQQQTPESVEAPPVPPPGAFYVWLFREGENYFTDIRSRTLTQVSWQINLESGDESNLITLEWATDVVQADGTLVLTDQAGSFTVDMFTETSYEIDTSQLNVVFIEYELQVE